MKRGRARFERALAFPVYRGFRRRATQATMRRMFFARGGMRGQFGGPFVRCRQFRGRRANGPIEFKFHDLDIDDAVIAVGGTIAQASCNLIAQGVTESERIGRKCTIKQINWRFQILLPNSANIAGGTNETVRVILYLDKQANGAAATVTGILESVDFQSFNNLSNKSRFRTLMDRVYNMNAQAGAGDGAANDTAGVQKNDSFYKKVNIPIEFDAVAGALTEIRSNNIGVLLLSKIGICLFESKMRLRYADG